MKYNTKPINYTGCHPVIAEHLKRNEAIECIVWDDQKGDGKVSGFVVGYEASKKYSYRLDGRSESAWKCAEPIPRKVRRIMPPERAIPVLIAEGWKFNQWGQMEHDDHPNKIIFSGAYEVMGLSLEEAEKIPMFWPDCIIEECEE